MRWKLCAGHEPPSATLPGHLQMKGRFADPGADVRVVFCTDNQGQPDKFGLNGFAPYPFSIFANAPIAIEAKALWRLSGKQEVSNIQRSAA